MLKVSEQIDGVGKYISGHDLESFLDEFDRRSNKVSNNTNITF